MKRYLHFGSLSKQNVDIKASLAVYLKEKIFSLAFLLKFVWSEVEVSHDPAKWEDKLKIICNLHKSLIFYPAHKTSKTHNHN